MHRYRLLGLVVTVLLTVALSLGLASAAAQLPAASGVPSFLGFAKSEPPPAAPAVSSQAAESDPVADEAVWTQGQALGEGQPQGVGRPEDKPTPPGLGLTKQDKKDTVTDDGYRAHPTGVTPEGTAVARYQIWCDGLHAVVNTDNLTALKDQICPTDAVLDAIESTTPADMANNATLQAYVQSLEDNAAVETFNFSSPLSHLNKLRAPSADEDVDTEEPEDQDVDEPEGESVTFSGTVQSIQGSKWTVQKDSEVVTVIVPGNVGPKKKGVSAAGATVTITGYMQGDLVKATKVQVAGQPK
ncbi:MAG: hypothetical protein M0Z94_09750 [Dehalococcoidales bacterium]|nr:hypothetical protein [Dehalococcoidales bacterium]